MPEVRRESSDSSWIFGQDYVLKNKCWDESLTDSCWGFWSWICPHTAMVSTDFFGGGVSSPADEVSPSFGECLRLIFFSAVLLWPGNRHLLCALSSLEPTRETLIVSQLLWFLDRDISWTELKGHYPLLPGNGFRKAELYVFTLKFSTVPLIYGERTRSWDFFRRLDI